MNQVIAAAFTDELEKIAIGAGTLGQALINRGRSMARYSAKRGLTPAQGAIRSQMQTQNIKNMLEAKAKKSLLRKKSLQRSADVAGAGVKDFLQMQR